MENQLDVQRALRDAVRAGLTDEMKSLPPWLFYDADGSDLYEQITVLPEYYPTRTERSIFADQADAIMATALGDALGPIHVFELGAGAATKTPLVLAPVAARGDGSHYTPIDVSPTALELAVRNVAEALPNLRTTPRVSRHRPALRALQAEVGRKVALFIGSSIGNYDDPEAIELLSLIRDAIAPSGALILGADRRKSAAVLVPAYDDRAGVTAAFNLNLLRRLNRELRANFDVKLFRHVALWNDKASRIEMHLESLEAQTVTIEALELVIQFNTFERIHTESSVKYADAHIDRLFAASGLKRTESFTDPEGLFAVHVAHVV